MFPIIKHEPFKKVNLLLNTGNLFSDERRFADLILKDKLSDYLYNDTEEFEATILSFTPEQKNDLLEAMKVFNKNITELLFETYYDQCKKDKRERWSLKPGTVFVNYIAVVKKSPNKPSTYVDLLSYRPIGIWFEKMVNLIAGNTIEYHEFERGLVGSRTSPSYIKIADLLAYLTNKYDCSIYLFTDCNDDFIVSFMDYFSHFCFENISFVENESLRNLGTIQEFKWKDKEIGSDDNYETWYLLDGNDVIYSDTYEDDDNSNTQ